MSPGAGVSVAGPLRPQGMGSRAEEPFSCGARAHGPWLSGSQPAGPLCAGTKAGCGGRGMNRDGGWGGTAVPPPASQEDPGWELGSAVCFSLSLFPFFLFSFENHG